MKADGSWLFSNLDTFCFNGTYGTREMRLLIVNYIRNNQNMLENHVDEDFNDYWDKMELDKTRETYTKLLAFLPCLKLISMYMIIFNDWSLWYQYKRAHTNENFHFDKQNGLDMMCFIL